MLLFAQHSFRCWGALENQTQNPVFVELIFHGDKLSNFTNTDTLFLVLLNSTKEADPGKGGIGILGVGGSAVDHLGRPSLTKTTNIKECLRGLVRQRGPPC